MILRGSSDKQKSRLEREIERETFGNWRNKIKNF